jgi:hypothetical protein
MSTAYNPSNLSFVERFKRFCAKVDTPPIAKQFKVFDVRYNIHKRSLPTGIDTPVLFGLPAHEAKQLLSTRFKTKLVEQEDDSKVLIYYDMVREDGVRSSVYDTPDGLIMQDSTNDRIINPRN